MNSEMSFQHVLFKPFAFFSPSIQTHSGCCECRQGKRIEQKWRTYVCSKGDVKFLNVVVHYIQSFISWLYPSSLIKILCGHASVQRETDATDAENKTKWKIISTPCEHTFPFHLKKGEKRKKKPAILLWHYLEDHDHFRLWWHDFSYIMKPFRIKFPTTWHSDWVM